MGKVADLWDLEKRLNRFSSVTGNIDIRNGVWWVVYMWSLWARIDSGLWMVKRQFADQWCVAGGFFIPVESRNCYALFAFTEELQPPKSPAGTTLILNTQCSVHYCVWSYEPCAYGKSSYAMPAIASGKFGNEQQKNWRILHGSANHVFLSTISTGT